jgi:hypothetical protein
MNFYSVLIMMFTISICCAIIPDVFSIANQNTSMFFHEEKCNDGSCMVTTCYNNQPCKTSTSSSNKTSTGNTSLLLADFL